jgi:hypothetical protein
MTSPNLVERSLYELAFRAETDARARAVLVAMLRTLFRLVVADRQRGGTRLLALARRMAVRYGRWRAPRVTKRLGVDVSRMDTLAVIQDWEDRVFGITGHWAERGATAATRCETVCPFARIASRAPELCTDVVHALETETFRALNPAYVLEPLETLLSKGHGACVFRHRLRPPAADRT